MAGMGEFEALVPEPKESIEPKYRSIFGSPMGREVLADILTECHFGSTLNPDNPAQVAEHNIGVMILAKCGIFGPGTRVNVINALCNIIPRQGGVER